MTVVAIIVFCGSITGQPIYSDPLTDRDAQEFLETIAPLWESQAHRVRPPPHIAYPEDPDFANELGCK